ncbi:MAG: WYL domain-containing protein [Firmicutes bacterium]|nr:WYL domain-containing protein [Bacillota bacterium]
MIQHILKASMERKCIVTIIYQKGDQITKRNIEVIDIRNDNVKAFCYLRNQPRIFKLQNILAASLYRKNNDIRNHSIKKSVNL